jgi:hypothetical protein
MGFGEGRGGEDRRGKMDSEGALSKGKERKRAF